MKKFEDYIVNGKITKNEVNKLKRDLNIYKERRFDALVGNGNSGKKNIDIRNSTVFFPKPHDYPNTFSILQSLIISEYSSVCGYVDFSNIAEIQYARYEKGEFFKKHRDTIYKDGLDKRILTCSINLSEETDYENGELVVYDESNNIARVLSKEIGSFIIFPAIFQHEAKEVTRGVREAIVTWIHSDDSTFFRLKKEIFSGEIIN